MADLGRISDETYGEAGAVIRAVAGTGPRPAVEVMPGFELMVAGAAMALSEGAPSAFYDSRVSHAEDYLAEGREEWRHFHVAVARAIDVARGDPVHFETPGDVMTHMVSDVMHQAHAGRMHRAIDNTDEAFMAGLSGSSRETVMYARLDQGVADSIRVEAMGHYDHLDEYGRREMANNLSNGVRVTAASRSAIEVAETAIDRHLERLPEIERERDSRLADFQDFGRDLFPKPADVQTEAHWMKAYDLIEGGVAPRTPVERGIVAHVALEEHDAMRASGGRRPVAFDLDRDVRDSERGAAYVRALAREAEKDAPHVGPAIEAARIEADIVGLRRLQEAATDRLHSDLSPADRSLGDTLLSHYAADVSAVYPRDRSMLALATGNLSNAYPQDQIDQFRSIRDLEGVPPLRVMDLSFAAAAVERGDLVVGAAREARENEMKRTVSYEGTGIEKLREEDQRWRDDLYLPGDRVRINDQVRVVGVDRDALHERFGAEPLEVERTIVRGDTRSNGLGGTYDAAFPEYEFKGHDGRFPAAQFQHERGDEHHYGAMVMKDERLWLVPMSENLDKPEVTGAAREVTSTIGSVEGMKSLEEAKAFFRDDAASGEFVVRPEAFGQKTGPVELVAVPWMSGLSETERALAGRAIEQAERGDRPGLGAAVGAALAAQQGR